MNKKIDIYTLLGLIKDGKAPKKVRRYRLGFFKDYNLNSHTATIHRTYESEDGTFLMDLVKIDDEVEILDEEYIKQTKEHKKNLLNKLAKNYGLEVIEKIENEFIDIESFGIHYSWDYIDYKNIEELKKYVNKDLQNIFDTLDKLIKNQKKIINKLKEEGK